MTYTKVPLAELKTDDGEFIETSGYLVFKPRGDVHYALAEDQDNKEPVLYIVPKDGKTLVTMIDLVFLSPEDKPKSKVHIQNPDTDSASRNITVKGKINTGVLINCSIVK